jgi:hypothetical protein
MCGPQNDPCRTEWSADPRANTIRSPQTTQTFVSQPPQRFCDPAA